MTEFKLQILFFEGSDVDRTRTEDRGGSDNDVSGRDGVQLYVYPGSSVQQEVGTMVVLDCLASDPTVRVQWERPKRAQSGRPTGSGEASPGRLIIDSAQESDSGVYTCRAMDSGGQLSGSMTVQLTIGRGGGAGDEDGGGNGIFQKKVYLT